MLFWLLLILATSLMGGDERISIYIPSE